MWDRVIGKEFFRSIWMAPVSFWVYLGFFCFFFSFYIFFFHEARVWHEM